MVQWIFTLVGKNFAKSRIIKITNFHEITGSLKNMKLNNSLLISINLRRLSDFLKTYGIMGP